MHVRLEPQNRSRRRKEAEHMVGQERPPRYLGGYNLADCSLDTPMRGQSFLISQF